MGDPVRQLGLAVEAGLAVARDEPARVRPPRWAACFSLLVGAPPLRTERICDQLLRQVLLRAVPTDLRVSCMCCRRAARRPRRSRAKATRTEKASTYRCRTQMHSRSCHAPSIERSQSRTFVLACSDLLLVALDLLVLVDERLQQVETPIFEQTTNLRTQSATLEPTKPRPRVRASSAGRVQLLLGRPAFHLGLGSATKIRHPAYIAVADSVHLHRSDAERVAAHYANSAMRRGPDDSATPVTASPAAVQQQKPRARCRLGAAPTVGRLACVRGQRSGAHLDRRRSR